MNDTRQTYRQLSEAETGHISAVKQSGEDFLATLRERGLEGREIALARTKIEEAVMWAVKGITG